MDILSNAFATLFTTPAIFAAFAGVAWGMIGGALPGISASIAMALLLLLTFGMEPTMALILLISVYVGAEYGGSIPAILIRTPGTTAAAATAIDGYVMHQAGRGGEALGISLVAGVIGGFIGIVLSVFLTEPLARVALLFTPAAYFSLGVLGLSVIASLTGRSVVKGYVVGLLGFAIATVGSDPQTGVARFTFGQGELLGGIRPIFALVGVFAISELMEHPQIHRVRSSTSATRCAL
jgi:putative tricarboxylic transport membrane protein